MEKNLPTQYQQFIHLSRYSRWLPNESRRETWSETVKRYFDFFETHLQEMHNYSISKKMREELENAKNKNKLTAQDTSDYMKLYDDWKGAKGDKAKKDEKLKGLRDIYKRVLYKKG